MQNVVEASTAFVHDPQTPCSPVAITVPGSRASGGGSAVPQCRHAPCRPTFVYRHWPHTRAPADRVAEGVSLTISVP